METKFNYFIVGFFVIFFTAALLIIGAWLYANGKSEVYNTYLAYMDESVAGLSENSPVKYNGVEVGYVVKISIDHDNPQRVKLLLNVEQGTPVNQSTVAVVMTQGLTGIGYVGLKVNGNDLTPLRAQKGQPYPVIKSGPSLLLRLDSSITKLVQSMEKISKSMNELLTPENRKALSHTFSNLDKFTNTLASHDKAIGNSINKLSTVLSNSAEASDDLEPIMNEINETAISLTELTQALANNPAVLLRGKQSPPPGPGE